MPPRKNRVDTRFFGVWGAKKGPSRRDVFWGMPPRILGSEPAYSCYSWKMIFFNWSACHYWQADSLFSYGKQNNLFCQDIWKVLRLSNVLTINPSNRNGQGETPNKNLKRARKKFPGPFCVFREVERRLIKCRTLQMTKWTGHMRASWSRYPASSGTRLKRKHSKCP